jgi:hypothetical protein
VLLLFSTDRYRDLISNLFENHTMDEIKFKLVNEYCVKVCAFTREQGRNIKIDDKNL